MSNDSQQDPPTDALIGSVVGGKYKINRILGEGGMGCVYEGEQKLGDTIRKVAVKTLHPHLSHDPKVLARFEREVGTVAGLQHPNTIQVFDFGKTDGGQLYIVMEFVSGRSVADVLEKDGAMAPVRVKKIMEQIAGSLEEAHNQGIVHRDLKPDNVVLCERAGQKDWVEVLDFGIAKRSTEEDTQEKKLTQQGMVLGTPPYMSPEQFTGKPIDKRSDIYSLGVMAYEMLTGRLPFSGNTAWEWATAHMTAAPISIDATPAGQNIPPAMKAAINTALEKDPARRWPTVTDFFQAFSGDPAHQLGPGLSGTSAMAAPPAFDVGPTPSRQKTEMGAPVVPAITPGYGTPRTGAMQGVPPGAYGTPSGGSQTYTPDAFPQPAPMMPPAGPQQQRSSGNGVLIAIIAVVGLLSLGAVGVYLVTSRDSGTKPIDTSVPTATTTTPTIPTTPATDTTSDSTNTVPTLETSHTTYTPPPPTHHDAGPTVATHDAGTVAPPTSRTVPPVTEPASCEAARTMRRAGQMQKFQEFKKLCEEAGGHV